MEEGIATTFIADYSVKPRIGVQVIDSISQFQETCPTSYEIINV